MMKKLGVLLAIILLLQAIFELDLISNVLLPSPLDLVNASIELVQEGRIFIHIIDSIKRVLIGFIIATALGVSIGLLLSYYKSIGTYFRAIIELIRPIPPIAWIPISILLFGLGDGASYFIVFIGAFFPIFTSTYSGAESIPQIYTNVSKSFELSKKVYIGKVLFYHSLPNIFTGLKIGIGMAWMSVIAAELLGAQSGLGYFIQLNRLLLRTDYVVVGMLIIGMVGLLLHKLIQTYEKIFIPWSIIKM